MTQDTPTAAQLIERRQQLKTHIDAQQKAFDEYLKPYKDGKEACENALLAMCNEQGVEAIKTEAGTAYISVITNFKVLDDERLIDLAVQNWREFGSELLSVGVTKDAAKRLIEENRMPQGILETSTFTRLNIRKS